MGMEIKTEWIICPVCGRKTHNKIRENTEMKSFPLYCPKCKKETIINVQDKFMHSPNSEIAKKRLALWLFHAENSDLPEFRSCAKTMHNWSEYILNSFDVPYSNGFTEGCNNKTKVLKRVCFGIKTFSILRNRILHCASHT